MTSSWESGGSLSAGTRHSSGMESSSSWRFLAAISSQDWLFCVVGSGRRRPAGVPPLARYRLPSANSREPTSGRGLQDVIAVTQKSEEEPPDGRVEKTRAFPLIASSEK